MTMPFGRFVASLSSIPIRLSNRMASTTSLIQTNRLKTLLRAGESTPVGCMIAEFRQPSVMQLMKNAGMDFVIIDNEHGPFNIETIADLTRTARYLDITPIVRIPEPESYHHIAQSLDSGAQGLMLPRISDAVQVQRIVNLIMYPPQGSRGNALSRGYTRFKSGNVVDAMRTCNEQTMIIAQVETRECLDNIDEIAYTLSRAGDGHVALIGPNDLSIALGVPGEQHCDVMQKAIEKVIEACRKHGVTPAIHHNDVKLAREWRARGMGLISCNSEAGFMVTAAANAVNTIKGL